MAELINHNGRPAISVDGKIYPPMMATIRTMEDRKRILFDEEYFAALGKSGIRIFFLICDTLWLKPTALELDFPGVLDGVRGMKFINAVCDSSEQGNVWKKV